MKRRTESQARSVLRERLEARRDEIEEAALTRAKAIADSPESDPLYAQGLRGAVAAAIDYAFEVTDAKRHGSPPIPVALLAQARLAARNGIPLDTVLRRYFAGYSLLGYFLLEEAGREGLMSPAELQRLLGTQASLFDRLLEAIAEEHGREAKERPPSSRRREVEHITRLLGGEMIDTADIAYDFDSWHLGVVATDPAPVDAIRDLAQILELRLLLVRPGQDGRAWGWLGGAQRPDSGEAADRLAASHMGRASVAFGEPAKGIDGWRLTHRQACAALAVAQSHSRSLPCYADVALLAAASRDDLLAPSLRAIYLTPLEVGPDGGEIARETLRAYIAAGCNMSSAAATLGVSRNTVARRLRQVETLIGRSVVSSVAELVVALRLADQGTPRVIARHGATRDVAYRQSDVSGRRRG